ncbi:hypothetical protein G6F65_022446 [Rhizopus arrhizus]|nr:hypothetical protein G6F65_022446 [Rhizopus arrhizus]
MGMVKVTTAARAVLVLSCAHATARLNTATANRPPTMIPGHDARGGNRATRLARASSNSSTAPLPKPMTRSVNGGKIDRMIFTAGQFSPQTSASAIGIRRTRPFPGRSVRPGPCAGCLRRRNSRGPASARRQCAAPAPRCR